MGFLVAAAVAAVVAGVAWWIGRSAERDRGAMLATETSTVATLRELAAAASAAAGAGSYRELVELSGEAAPGPGGPLRSPESSSTAEETVTSESSESAFVLRDATGEVLVEPTSGVDGARRTVSEFREGRRGGGRDTIGFEHEEWVLEPGTRLFVRGEVSERDGRLVVGEPSTGDLVVTTRSEEQLLASAAGSARTAGIASKVAAVAAVGLAVVGAVSLL